MLRRALNPLLALVFLGCATKDGAALPRTADARALQPVAAPAAPHDSVAALLAKADAGRILGNASATVWLIVISDFQCPYCKRWHDESWATIKKDYVDTGKIRVAYVNLPLEMHRNAWPAAQVAMCAGVQGRFWPMQDALFLSQQEWEHLQDPTAKFEAMAASLGADIPALQSCVKNSATRPLIQADADRAAQAGASSTPTFFVGGRVVVGAQPLPAFREALDAALAAAAAKPAAKPAGK